MESIKNTKKQNAVLLANILGTLEKGEALTAFIKYSDAGARVMLSKSEATSFTAFGGGYNREGFALAELFNVALKVKGLNVKLDGLVSTYSLMNQFEAISGISCSISDVNKSLSAISFEVL